MTKTHKNVFRHLCDKLDQDLDSPACRNIKNHLAGCPDCVRYLDSLMATVSLYRRYPTPRLTSTAKKKLRSIAR